MATIYTIGYEGTDIERFVQTLKVVGVKILVDVRALALSRKKGFSKTALKTRLEREGIAYLHFVDLGDPKPGRQAAREGRYSTFRRIYARHLSSDARTALTALHNAAKSAPTCLLCFERDPKECHRSIVAERLTMAGADVFDLYGDRPARYADHAAKLPRHHSREGAAAA
jgi:uncharacterized protein (DUF488 family)